jgi:hypothetical protein
MGKRGRKRKTTAEKKAKKMTIKTRRILSREITLIIPQNFKEEDSPIDEWFYLAEDSYGAKATGDTPHEALDNLIIAQLQPSLEQ